MNNKICLLTLIVLISANIGYTQSNIVQIESGLLSGLNEDGSSVIAYKGIPYASPPVGDLRWKPPQPKLGWQGIYAADNFGPTCMQIPPPEGSFYHTEFYTLEEPKSEDCLYLNVWTNTKMYENERPVMVWIHGGAFSQGSGSMPTFNGQSFAEKGVVLVTINYRLGIFGLFAHPDLTEESKQNFSGNYGLLDQVAALKWIQKNIEAFGGDPNNVTIFGQSSGAGNINKLMTSPLTEGLFNRAILQSGNAYVFGETQTLEQAENDGKAFMKEYDAASVEELRDWPAEKLLEEGSKFSFHPNIDGWFLSDEPLKVFEKGGQHNIPVLLGSNSDEGSTLYGPKLNAEIFKNIINRSYGENAEKFLTLYPHKTDKQARNSFNKAWTDEMAWGSHTFARIHSQTKNVSTYLYFFDRIPPGRDSDRYGAFHSSEIAYLFNTLNTIERPWTEVDRTLAPKLQLYWINFAKKGNPNGKDLTKWPVYNSKNRKVLKLGKQIEADVILREDILKFYNNRFNDDIN